MNPEETPVEQARRRVQHNEERIAQQRALIARLAALHQDHLLPEARRILTMMEGNQRLFSAQLQAMLHEGRA